MYRTDFWTLAEGEGGMFRENGKSFKKHIRGWDVSGEQHRNMYII